MKRWRALAVAVCLASTMGSPGVFAREEKGPRCHRVDADFTSVVDDPSCLADMSPDGCVATGRIRHDHYLKGTMQVTLEGAGLISPPVFWVSGTRTLTPRYGGTLTAHVVGVFDLGTGVFSEINTIEGGTGRFADAYGLLSVFGQPIDETTFGGEIRGTVCVP